MLNMVKYLQKALMENMGTEHGLQTECVADREREGRLSRKRSRMYNKC